MSINKKTMLGKVPIELGIKDAVHTAIVSLRAGSPLNPGQRITLNEEREAVAGTENNSFGIADPFRTETILRGESFWGVMNMEDIPNVRHDWDHPQHTFEPPSLSVKRNQYIERYATAFGVSYESLMAACRVASDLESQTDYSGPLDESVFEEAWEDMGSDLWYEWSSETNYEFENNGSNCCPEREYPDNPFRFVEPTPAHTGRPAGSDRPEVAGE